ncbi:MAG: hypothetical protein ACYDDF_03475 [Thermoplasmatota archaeon]
MSYLAAAFGSLIKARVVDRLLRRGPASIGELAADVGASRQHIAAVVSELALLGIVCDIPGGDRRERRVGADPQHPFLEPLRILASDGGAWYEEPATWQLLLAKHFGRDWYIGGYAAIRRVMQPVDFESPSVLANVLKGRERKGDVRAVLRRASGVELTLREIPRIPPDVVPIDRSGTDVWFASPNRGFVEALGAGEIDLYGLMLCFVQGLREEVLDPARLLAVAAEEGVQGDIAALMKVARRIAPAKGPALPRHARPLTPAEKKAFDHAVNTVVG